MFHWGLLTGKVCMLAQGYVVYSRKKKLKEEFIDLPGNEIRDLKLSGVEICYDVEVSGLLTLDETPEMTLLILF